MARKVSLDQQLAELPKMSRKSLEQLWRELFGHPPGRALRRETLIPTLAYRLQEKAYGGLKAPVAKRLRAILEEEKRSGGASTFRPKAGTRIVREWQGRLHEVSVLKDGYEYDKQTYRSLSEIARGITGTRWSGPAFFGIKRRAPRQAA